MPNVMPQVALHRLIQEGIAIIKQNPDVLDKVFEYYTCEPMDTDYGAAYVKQIKQWFIETKIPVVQAWSLNPQKAPQISIKLATEQEDETKSAIGDFWDAGEEAEIGTAPFIAQLDIAIHASRNSDETLWLYEIICFILFKRKRRAEKLGLQLHTFSATDYNRDNSKLADNIFVRTIRFRAIVQKFWDAEDYIDIDDVEVEVFTQDEECVKIPVKV